MINFKNIILKLASLKGSTRNISLSFAIGVLIGFSPFLGLHMIIGISLCLLTKLSKPALLTGLFVNLPWITVPYYAFATWLGMLILRMPGTSFTPDWNLSYLMKAEFRTWLVSKWVLLIPAFTGSILLSMLLAALAYITISMALGKFRSVAGKSGVTLDTEL